MGFLASNGINTRFAGGGLRLSISCYQGALPFTTFCLEMMSQ